jgi:hypothetical protein
MRELLVIAVLCGLSNVTVQSVESARVLYERIVDERQDSEWEAGIADAMPVPIDPALR